MDSHRTPPSGFMQAAAEKAIADLRERADAAKAAAVTAKEAADGAARSARRWKVLTVVLGIVVLMCAYLVVLQHHETLGACNDGNARAAGTVTALDELVTLLEGPHPAAKTRAEAAQYEAFVAVHNPQRDCSAVFSYLP